ncbi:hypothetical protein IMZ29_12675 [Achromobacter sp. GG226]|uniref:hypothetical protein n=1 Tax=Verticiella alkaliphila TaxID=2779529 RepID=UPI001C0CFF61|nr:hypothetical protein [Verticiella sp. GG226]MBU4611351.1 hypothetical protein [Verticiella sp. GG226]
MMTRLDPQSMDRQDPGEAAFAAEPVVDGDCVRFTYFFGVRGPQVFEVPLPVLRALGAQSAGTETLLQVFHAHEREIAHAARRHRETHGRAVIVLTAADLPRAPA